jgi:hypothetical protein
MSKSPLLKETIARRMLKLANIGAINTENFINETYESLDEDKAYTAKKEEPGDDAYLEEGLEEGSEVYQEEDDDESMGDPSETHTGELDYEGDMEADLAGDEEAAMDLEGGGKEEKFKEIVDMLADLLDVEADVELEGGEELEPMAGEEEIEDIGIDTSADDIEGGEVEVEDEEEIEGGAEEELMEALTARVTDRIAKMQEAQEQAKAQKEQIAESVADRIMKRLES